MYFFQGAKAPSGAGPPHCRVFTITLKTHHIRYDSSGRVISHTQSTLPDNTHNRKKFVPPAGFKLPVSTSEWPKNHALDHAATVISKFFSEKRSECS